MRSRWVVFAISILLFCGCAHLPQPVRSSHLGESTEAGQCAGFFASLDHTVKGFGIRDPGEFRIPNFPYLRVNRFLASFRNELTTNDAFNTWIDHLLTLDRNARRHEIANLPPDMSEALRSDRGAVKLYDRVVACGDLLRVADFGALQQISSLQKSAKAPDDYITLRRVFGIYPLTSIFVSIGVNNLHKTVHRSFSLQAPQNWHGIRYMPEISNKSQPPPVEIMRQAERDAIGIPRFSAEAKEALFRFFAPVWEIQTESDDDRIGTPHWSIEGTLRIDTAKPVVFEHLSYTRFKGDILTQLNYIIWFPSRPKKHSFDLFGGFLDGLIYRVTLDVDGQPLLYDTVHNCGCYHKFYPTARLEALAKNGYTEPPLILEAPSLNPQTERMVIGLESETHYVRFLYALNRGQEVDTISYVFADYDLLRSLPHAGGGYRSFFGESGIVSGSERTERYILWPMGVLSPGAMRQWGRHAVAFVGRRHFDDPDLINKNFKRNENLHRSSQ